MPTPGPVDKKTFKTADESLFCAKHRLTTSEPEVSVVAGSLDISNNEVKASLEVEGQAEKLNLSLYVTSAGCIRTQIDQSPKRWRPTDVLVERAMVPATMEILSQNDSFLECAISDGQTLKLNFKPFSLSVVSDGEDKILLNKFGQLYYNKNKEIGADVTLPGSNACFGLPERTTSFAIPDTIGKDAYRMYNLDVCFYGMDEPLGLYGAIPIVVSHSNDFSCGVFWNNPSDTFVDFSSESAGRKIKWMSESGNFDLILFPGKTLPCVMKQIKDTTGPQMLPPMFSLGYHQCRYSYDDQKDLLEVNQGFEKYNIPMDVLWLDVDHTDGKRYLTFDKEKYPDPRAMYHEIDACGRKVVNICDPHVKVDENYFVHKEATEQRLYIRDSEGKEDFKGDCWPGESSYLDFTSEKVRAFWSKQFTEEKHEGAINGITYIWNDMNEPSVFKQAEGTAPKDCQNIEGVEFREFHNLYGMSFHAATQAGLHYRDLVATGSAKNLSKQQIEDIIWRNMKYDPEATFDVEGNSLRRSFVLTRSFFAGAQRYGAVWTGDNAAEWSHLRASVPMLLSLSMAGFAFCGADVGGFFNDPPAELLIRWYQAGALQPFFRAHADISTKRREPWLFGEKPLELIKQAIAFRYRLLPFIYTTFREAEETGLPVMRPMFLNFPDDITHLENQDQWMLGDSLLIAPVLKEKASERKVCFPNADWFDLTSFKPIDIVESHASFPVSLESMLVFQKAGSILPIKETARKSTHFMQDDPITLLIALDSNARAKGTLYLDDESSFDYNDRKAFCNVEFSWDCSMLQSITKLQGRFLPKNRLAKIILLGAKNVANLNSVKIGDGDRSENIEANITFEEANGSVKIEGLNLDFGRSFSLKIE